MKAIGEVVVVVLCFLILTGTASAQEKPGRWCDIAVNSSIGLYSNYFDETGEILHRRPTSQGTFDVEVCSNKKVSAGVIFWGSLSTKINPSGATEADLVGYVHFKPTHTEKVLIEGGRFWIEGGSIDYLSATVSKEFEARRGLSYEAKNQLAYFKVGPTLHYSSGVINKSTLDIQKSFKEDQFALILSPAMLVDNNPFSLGHRQAVVSGMLKLRSEVRLNSTTKIFAESIVYKPFAGETERHFSKNFGVGMTFRIR